MSIPIVPSTIVVVVPFTVRAGEVIEVLCRILEVREGYFGRIDWQVEPVSGSGRTWVDSRRCKRVETEKGISCTS